MWTCSTWMWTWCAGAAGGSGLRTARVLPTSCAIDKGLFLFDNQHSIPAGSWQQRNPGPTRVARGTTVSRPHTMAGLPQRARTSRHRRRVRLATKPEFMLTLPPGRSFSAGPARKPATAPCLPSRGRLLCEIRGELKPAERSDELTVPGPAGGDPRPPAVFINSGAGVGHQAGKEPLAGERSRRSNSRGTGNQVSGIRGGFPTDSPRLLNSPPTSAPTGITERFPTELSGGYKRL